MVAELKELAQDELLSVRMAALGTMAALLQHFTYGIARMDGHPGVIIFVLLKNNHSNSHDHSRATELTIHSCAVL
jgi:hypothetical protein